MDTPLDLREQRRRQILAAAAKVFADQGYHATRIQQIAAEAGVAYGLVYHYFGSKDALLRTVFDESWAAFADDVEGIAASGRDVADQIRAVLDYLFGAWAEHPEVVKVVVLEYGRSARVGEALVHPGVGRALRAIGSIYQRAADEGRLAPGAHAASLPLIFMGALEATFAALLLDGKDAAHTHRATLRALFRDALVLPPGARDALRPD